MINLSQLSVIMNMVDIKNTLLYKNLNFTVFNLINMTISEILVLIDGVNNFNHTTLNQSNRSRAFFNFTAASASTQICFDYFLNMTEGNHTIGPSLDNLTLQIYPPSPINNNSTTISSGSGNPFSWFRVCFRYFLALFLPLKINPSCSKCLHAIERLFFA